MRLTEHFTLEEMIRSEAAIRHGLDNIPPSQLIPNILACAAALEKIRAYFGHRKIYVTSCYRSPEVNKAVGGSKTSAHTNGAAVDFEVDGVSNLEVYRAVPEIIPEFDQVIYEFGEAGWVHLGFSQSPRHQQLAAIKENGATVYRSGLDAI